QFRLGALALDELTDLAADRSQHLEQFLIGLPDLAAEKLDHAQDFPSEQDRKCERRVQSFALGDGPAPQVSISNAIRNVLGFKAGPDPARQSRARNESEIPADPFEFRDFDRRLVPKLDTTQRPGLAVRAPQSAHVPSQIFAYGLQHS